MADPATIASLVLKGMDLTITMFENKRRSDTGALEEYIQVRNELRKALVAQAVASTSEPDVVSPDPPTPAEASIEDQAEGEDVDVPSDD